jgi:hypothetical protein
MNFAVLAILGSGVLFALMLLLVDIGYRIGRKRHVDFPDVADEGLLTVDAAVYGLLGLILAFTLNGAANRLDIRRAQIVQEANAIGTAYLRVDLLPASEQPAIRTLFRQYLDSRIEVYDRINAMSDYAAGKAALDKGDALQKEIWTHAVTACQSDPKTSPCLLLLPALNEMIDITTVRSMAFFTHVHPVILGLLILLSLLAAMLAGFDMSQQPKRSALHSLLFALAISTSIYVVMDMEYPRFGLINLRSMDRSIVQLRDTIK